MLRLIAGVIVGWIVMAILVMATFAITVLALGLEGTLQPESYWTTNTFNVIVLAGGFIAAILGGVVCMAIARDARAAYALATIIIAFGLASAVMNMNKSDPPARAGDPTLQDITSHGKEPNWFAFTTPALSAAGILIGSGLSRRKPAR